MDWGSGSPFANKLLRYTAGCFGLRARLAKAVPFMCSCQLMDISYLKQEASGEHTKVRHGRVPDHAALSYALRFSRLLYNRCPFLDCRLFQSGNWLCQTAAC